MSKTFNERLFILTIPCEARTGGTGRGISHYDFKPVKGMGGAGWCCAGSFSKNQETGDKEFMFF